jgi:hypothetical protein
MTALRQFGAQAEAQAPGIGIVFSYGKEKTCARAITHSIFAYAILGVAIKFLLFSAFSFGAQSLYRIQSRRPSRRKKAS